MDMPMGFLQLVKMVMKEQPILSQRPAQDAEIWRRFLRIIFLGGNRSDAEINYLLTLFGPALEIEYVLKTRGEPLEAELSKALNAQFTKEKDADLKDMLEGLERDLFRVVASMKGSARWFEKTKMSLKALDKMAADRDTTDDLIHELAEDEDVTNIKFTKIILWLHSVGKGEDFCPPSRQIKDFCNKDIGPYYRFYEDDKYFMEKIQEFAVAIKEDLPDATVYDVSKAIFYYRVTKGMAGNLKTFTPTALIKFLKKEKMDLNKLAVMLGDLKKRKALEKKLGGKKR